MEYRKAEIMEYRKADIMRSAVLLCDLERFYIRYDNIHTESPIVMEEVHFPSFVNGMFSYKVHAYFDTDDAQLSAFRKQLYKISGFF